MRNLAVADSDLELCPRGRHYKEGRQQALLDAASRVFAEHGFDAATTREVAERAGCSEGLIHRYFGGKRGLLLALLESRAEKSAANLRDLPVKGLPVLDVVRQILRIQLDAIWESQDIMRVNVSRGSIDAEIGQVISERFNEVRVAQILEYLRALAAEGRVREDVDLDSIAHSLAGLGFALGFWAQVAFGQDRAAVRHNADEAAAVIARGLERPLTNS
jgi:AcrR family transcriptional regulator